ncbi:hypothetical protein EJ02DRAFT_25832 [Clathrospora elynae]|uniref:Uncharacterized protein n=1 Tax=Clathrospora elynae TaxID=706981 RepID=A0A6A5SZH7_9PLEO|nr:hypothetical protein EJ02DRAFT_25832 [Clathrospora elynae]
MEAEVKDVRPSWSRLLCGFDTARWHEMWWLSAAAAAAAPRCEMRYGCGWLLITLFSKGGYGRRCYTCSQRLILHGLRVRLSGVSRQKKTFFDSRARVWWCVKPCLVLTFMFLGSAVLFYCQFSALILRHGGVDKLTLP